MAQYYVRTDGSDSNDGLTNSSGGAWLTIQEASDNMVAGDTVTVQAGTYAELVDTVNSGSSGNLITFETNGSVTVGGFDVIGESYIVIDGFTFSGSGTSANEGTVSIRASSSYITVNDCYFGASGTDVWGFWCDHAARLVNSPQNLTVTNCSFIQTDNHAMQLFGDNHLVEGNTWTNDDGFDAIRCHASDTTFRNNTFDGWSNTGGSSNHTDIIQSFSDNLDTSSGVVFERNLIIDCEECQIGNLTDDQDDGKVSDWTFRNNVYVRIDQAISTYIPETKFYNNTFIECTQNTGHPLLFRGSGDRGNADDSECYNNIFVDCGSDPTNVAHGWYQEIDSPSNFLADNNLVVGTGAGETKTGFSETNGINGTAPTFTNDAGDDYTLASGSEGIDDGATIAGFSNDKDGNTRGATWDIGAYEYGASAGNTLTCATLTLNSLTIG